MFTLRCPLQRNYLDYGKICTLTQLWAENKNALFYGPQGHLGIDFRTINHWKYKKAGKWIAKEDGTFGPDAYWQAEPRTAQEQNGRIPIVAAHDGETSFKLYDDKEGMGWGVYVTANSIIENGQLVQYRTLYWHIETPWNSLATFAGIISKAFNKQVKAGSIIAMGGNNGKSTGPHLHFQLEKRYMILGNWTEWKPIDPMPYFSDPDIVMNRIYSLIPAVREYYYLGGKIEEAEAKKIIASLPNFKIYEKNS